MKKLLTLLIVFVLTISIHPQWQRTFGPFGWSVYHIAEGNGYIYSSGGILFRSSDNGLTWQEKSMGIAEWDVTTLFVSGSRVFAGLSAGNGVGYLYFSDDNGELWLKHNATGNTKDITGFAKVGNDIFFSTHQAGIFKSTNNGTNWSQVIPGWNPKPAIFTLKNVGNTLFFGEYTGLYKSTDMGITWTHCQVNPDNNCEVYSIAVKNTTIFVVYGSCWGYTSSVYKSTDLGATFQLVAPSISNALSVYSDGVNVYLGTENGLWRSTDDGGSWALLTLAGETVHTTITSSNGNIMAGTRDHGIFTSTNNGVTWINTGVGNWMTSKAVLSTGNTLMAGNDGQKGVMISRDNGNTFTEFNDLDNSYVNTLNKRGADIFAGTTPYIPQKGGVFKSSDNGVSWARIGLENTDVLSIAFSPIYLFAGTTYQGVFRTSDDGVTWANLSNGLPSALIRSLAYYNNVVYAGTQTGLYKTTNDGVLWSLNGFQNIPVIALAVHNNKLFAATESGVFLLDGTGNWVATSLTGTINTLKTVEDKLIAGGDNILSMTSDDGSNWSPIWRNLPVGSVLDVSFNNEYIFVGRAADGAWRGNINNICSSIEEVETSGKTDFLEPNHPNPFANVTKIRYQVSFSLPEYRHGNGSDKSVNNGSRVSLKVYDVLGREVAVLVEEEQSPGAYEIEFDGSGLTGGVYYYQLRAGKFADTKKMLLIR